jgi:hypothetical protein
LKEEVDQQNDLQPYQPTHEWNYSSSAFFFFKLGLNTNPVREELIASYISEFYNRTDRMERWQDGRMA